MGIVAEAARLRKSVKLKDRIIKDLTAEIKTIRDELEFLKDRLK